MAWKASVSFRRSARVRRRRRVGWWCGRLRLRLLLLLRQRIQRLRLPPRLLDLLGGVLVPLLDPLLLPVADQPAQHPGLVDADDDVVYGVVVLRVVGQPRRRAVSVVELGRDLVEILHELPELLAHLAPVLLVLHQTLEQGV